MKDLVLAVQMNSKKIRDPQINLDPDMQLEDSERADIVSILETPGWFAVRKLMEIEIRKFDLALKNADPADQKDVLAKHVLSKAASMFYAQIINRLNTEQDQFFSAAPPDTVLPSVTDALFVED